MALAPAYAAAIALPAWTLTAVASPSVTGDHVRFAERLFGVGLSAEFLVAAKYLVKPAGSICLIYHTSRLTDCLAEAERQHLVPVRLRFVHGSPEAEARMFLVELVKGRKGELAVLSPCFVSGIGDERAEMPHGKGGETG